jgi:hypothetical protein
MADYVLNYRKKRVIEMFKERFKEVKREYGKCFIVNGEKVIVYENSDETKYIDIWVDKRDEKGKGGYNSIIGVYFESGGVRVKVKREVLDDKELENLVDLIIDMIEELEKVNVIIYCNSIFEFKSETKEIDYNKIIEIDLV